MVAASFTVPEVNVRWIFYLTLSICVNVLIVQAITMGSPKVALIEMPSIKLNLKALTKVNVQPTQHKKNTGLQMQATSKEVVMQKGAKKKISASVSESITTLQIEKHEPKLIGQQITPLAKPTLEEVVDMAETAGFESFPTEQKGDLSQDTTTEKSVLELNGGEDSSSAIHEANYRRQTVPPYPRRAFELGQEGTVTLHAEVMANGLPRELKVMKSSGYRLLDTAALAAVKKWEFEPTSINGNSIVSWVRVPVNFVIKQ